MSSLFDGMSDLIADVLGDEVSYTPSYSLTARPVQSVFREQPTEAIDPDGHPVLTLAPTWMVRPSLVPELARGDRIEPGNGKTYAVLNIQPSGSPAVDAAVTCELERIFAT